MSKWLFTILFLLLFVLTPVTLAVSQDVPARGAYQHAVLLASLGAFGLTLGLFWLSRLLPRDTVKMKRFSIMRWHRVLGYTVGTFLLLHPVLMIGRRFWVQESNPVDNLVLLLRSPLLLPGIAAWVVMLAVVVLSYCRRIFPISRRRYLHGLLSVGFAVLATWHVVAVGRHSNTVLSVFWVVLAAGSIVALLVSYLPVRRSIPAENSKGDKP